MFHVNEGRVMSGRKSTTLTFEETMTFMRDSVTRRQQHARNLGFGRLKVGLDEVQLQFLRTGTTSYRLRVPHSLQPFVADLDCDVQITSNEAGYEIFCSGRYPEGAVIQANRRLLAKLNAQKNEARTARQYVSAPIRRRKKNPARVERRVKRRHLRELQRKAANAMRNNVPKVKRQPQAAAFTLMQNIPKKGDAVVRQHKNQRLFFKEAIETVIATFDIENGEKWTAYQLVDRELRRSMKVLKQGALEAGRGTSVAIFKLGGFTLRFDIADGGSFRGELTPVTIAVTEDNKDPRYRKVRTHLSSLLLGLNAFEQRKRRALLWPEEQAVALAA